MLDATPIKNKIVGFYYLHIYFYLGEWLNEFYQGFVLIETHLQKGIIKV